MQLAYPEFHVSGVNDEDVWQLFNVSNWEYYREKVADLQKGVCPFCPNGFDSKRNIVVEENESWMAWNNTMAPRPDHKFQFLIAPKRHVTVFVSLTAHELLTLREIVSKLESAFDITGGVLLVRTGDPAFNAKSVDHLHFNYHIPNGTKKTEITIGKSLEDLNAKLPVLRVFEKMRLTVCAEWEADPTSALTAEEYALVKDKIKPPAFR